MSGPAVEIRIHPGANRELVDLTATRTGRRLTLDLPFGTLEKARDEVPEALQEFKDNVGSSLVPSTEDAKAALRNLFLRSTVLGGILTNRASAGMEQLRALFAEAIPDWETRTDIPLVQVEGPAYGFPFELLPVFKLDRPGHLDDPVGFARRFLGFSAAVRRVPYVGITTSTGMRTGRVLKSGPLPVSFAWYQPMDGARKEHDFFVRNGDHVELNGPWPASSLSLDEVVARLAEGLVDPRRRYASPELAREIQIHHLAGHSDTRAREPADYELEIAGEDGESRPITFLRLYNEFMFADTDSTLVGAIAHLPPKPLVFLNACGSAHKDPRRVYSWPEWFLQTGHCAVIGPETLVPDDAAAQYACFFYEALFSQRTAGEALVLARRELLHQYGNPLGLLYVLYGDSSVAVDHPIQQEERDGGVEGSRPG